MASFNVENLFARPIVFKFRDKKVGDDLLERIGNFGKILKKKSSTETDKSKLVKEYTLGGIGSAARIFKSAMAADEQESLLEAFVEQKKLLANSGLTAEEITEFKQLTA